jgi:dTDP-glucose pyrophosphorylase
MSQQNLPCLVVLAAGMGSRFGGDKQLAVLGTTDRTILHFSVMDAYDAGVRQVILVVRQAIIKAMQQQVLAYFPADLQVQLVVQALDDLPVATVDSTVRQKPWGTAHALWCARQFLQQQPCIVINADDYYNVQAMQLLMKHFTTEASGWAMVAFQLSQTLSAFGGVNRGICKVQQGQLQSVSEWTEIQQQQQLQGRDASGEIRPLSAEQPVSMNIWGFTPTIVPILTQALTAFLQQPPVANAECYLPAVVDQAIHQGQQLQVYLSQQRWFGVTYPDDLAEVVDYFQHRNAKYDC